VKTILKDLSRGSGNDATIGLDGSEPDTSWDSGSSFEPGFQAGPLNVAGSFANSVFIGAGPANDGGANLGPLSPTSSLSSADGGVVFTLANRVETNINVRSLPVASGFHINLIYDAAALAAPQSFRDGLQAASNMLSAAISDNITVNINIDYSGTGAGAAAGPDSVQFLSYSTVRSTLIANASLGDSATFNSLPDFSSIAGQSQVAVFNAQLKLFGLMSANDTTTDDGGAIFATDIDPTLLPGVALHELTHALGRVAFGPQEGEGVDIFDMFRFTTPGVRLVDDADTEPASYFSLDGGFTKLADYGETSDPSDFLNSGVQGPTDPFNEFYSPETLQQLTAIDLAQLDALGFHLTSVGSPVTIESSGATRLVQVGIHYFLNPVGGGTGPELKYFSSGIVTNVAAGEFSDWSPIAAEQVSGGSGYDVVWKKAGADQYTAWRTDSNGTFTSSLMGWVSGSSNTLESLEPIFKQDLNGDGHVGGAATSTIESFGSTSLVEVANNFFLNPVAGGTGPELKYNGSPVTAGGFGDWLPIAAEQVSNGGYLVAWKEAGVDQYTAWTVDGSGNFTSSAVGFISGAHGSLYELESLESIFHQDLNSDGFTGVPIGFIEQSGSTTLKEIANNYFLNPISGGTGPELKYNSAPVVAGEFADWLPVGAEQTPNGYIVAWKELGVDEYTAWTTDANGNFTSSLMGWVSGSSYALESLEPVLHQDLNGDNLLGARNATIEASGSTSLVDNANLYSLNPVSGGTGPGLKYNFSNVFGGEFGDWLPIAAEKTATGYDVAWKEISADQYTAWATDTNGNFTSSLMGWVAGGSSALTSLEPIFHQDLNGNGVIG